MTEFSDQNNGFILNISQLNAEDHDLIAAAIKTLEANFHPIKHQLGCALRTLSGKIYSAVHIHSTGYSIHAEAVALGMAIANGERNFASIVTVKKIDDAYPVISPCGNCRQLILDYASEAMVIFSLKGEAVKAKASELLPGPYENSFTAITRFSGLDQGQ